MEVVGGSGGEGTAINGSGGGGGRRRLPSSRNRSAVELVGGGGNTHTSGGGFSGGGNERAGTATTNTSTEGGVNGLQGEIGGNYGLSGSYFEAGTPYSSTYYAGFLGGSRAICFHATWKTSYFVGDGGTGGSGGTVYVESDLSRIHAYNGAYVTEVNAIDQTDSWKQENQSIIYAQVGYSLVDLRADTEELEYTYSTTTYTTEVPVVTSISARTATDLITELGTSYRSIDYSVYTTYGAMGIGSGGGCIEVSNGTLTVE